jgi:hypothetical protein
VSVWQGTEKANKYHQRRGESYGITKAIVKEAYIHWL